MNDEQADIISYLNDQRLCYRLFFNSRFCQLSIMSNRVITNKSTSANPLTASFNQELLICALKLCPLDTNLFVHQTRINLCLCVPPLSRISHYLYTTFDIFELLIREKRVRRSIHDNKRLELKLISTVGL